MSYDEFDSIDFDDHQALIEQNRKMKESKRDGKNI